MLMISADARSRGWTGWSFVPILWWPSMILAGYIRPVISGGDVVSEKSRTQVQAGGRQKAAKRSGRYRKTRQSPRASRHPIGFWAHGHVLLQSQPSLGLAKNVCLLAIVSSGIRRAYVRPGSRDDGPALQKNFSSRYNCNVPDFRRQSASAAASSVLASGHCSTSETPASASLLTLRSMVDAAASNTGGIGAT